MDLFLELKSRNELLFYFGISNICLALILLLVSRLSSVELVGVNIWYKPIKFALSIGIYTLTMAWFMYYLPQSRDINIINWLIIIMLGFEIIYITLQASRGQLSHFNNSTPFYSLMYSLMGIAATFISLATLYIVD